MLTIITIRTKKGWWSDCEDGRASNAQCGSSVFHSVQKGLQKPLDVVETDPFKSRSRMRSSTFRSPPQASGNWHGQCKAAQSVNAAMLEFHFVRYCVPILCTVMSQWLGGQPTREIKHYIFSLARSLSLSTTNLCKSMRVYHSTSSVSEHAAFQAEETSIHQAGNSFKLPSWEHVGVAFLLATFASKCTMLKHLKFELYV